MARHRTRWHQTRWHQTRRVWSPRFVRRPRSPASCRRKKTHDTTAGFGSSAPARHAMTQGGKAVARADWGPFGLRDRVAIVTGAALGIGRRTAQRVAEAGAAVVLVDRDEGALATTLNALVADGVRATSIAVDVADPSAGDDVVAHCRRELGEVDVLVNNAGIYPMIPLADLDDRALRNVLDVNLIGTINMARAAGLSMIERGEGGAIVNIASIDG